MRQQTRSSKEPAEKVVQDIRRATRKQYSAEEKREPASDIDTAVVDSLKVLDPERPIREVDIGAGPRF